VGASGTGSAHCSDKWEVVDLLIRIKSQQTLAKNEKPTSRQPRHVPAADT